MKRSMETDFFGTACRNLILDSALLWTLLGPHKRRYVFGKGVYETLLTKLDMGWMGKHRVESGSYFCITGLCHEIELIPYKNPKGAANSDDDGRIPFAELEFTRSAIREGVGPQLPTI